jgi:hypothetical protein
MLGAAVAGPNVLVGRAYRENRRRATDPAASPTSVAVRGQRFVPTLATAIR